MRLPPDAPAQEAPPEAAHLGRRGVGDVKREGPAIQPALALFLRIYLIEIEWLHLSLPLRLHQRELVVPGAAVRLKHRLYGRGRDAVPTVVLDSGVLRLRTGERELVVVGAR